MATFITKLSNSNVYVNRIDRRYNLEKTLTPELETGSGLVRIMDRGKQADVFHVNDVVSVTRQDGTVIPINDEDTLFTELRDNFFFELIGGGNAAIPESQTVDNYLLLPDFSQHVGEYWITDNPITTGSILLLNRQTFDAGVWKATAGGWSYKGPDTPFYFVDNNLVFKDDGDNTKNLGYQLDQISPSTIRIATWQDKDGTVAYLDDLAALQIQIAENAIRTQGKITAISASTLDPNVLTPVVVPMSTLRGNNVLSYLINSGGIEIPVTGYYRAGYKLVYQTLANQRSDISGQLQNQGTPISGTVSSNYGTRNNANPLGFVSLPMTDLGLLNAGDVITLIAFRAGTQAGAATLISNETIISLEYLGT